LIHAVYDCAMESGLVSAPEVRAAVERLERHYGSLPQVADATGISYRTLQSVRHPTKLKQVQVRTAQSILAADADPPEVETVSPWDKKNVRNEVLLPLVETLERHYGSLRYASEITGIPLNSLRSVKFAYGGHKGLSNASARRIIEAVENPLEIEPLDDWNRRYVPVSDVRPHVDFLVTLYGSLAQAHDATGIPTSTLGGILKQDGRGVKRETAAKIQALAENPPNVVPVDIWHKKFDSIEEIQPLVMDLLKHYKDFHNLSKATNLPEGTLFGIYQGKKRGVTKSTAAKIRKAHENPPQIAIQNQWERRYIATERVTPLVLFLVKTYGSLKAASEMSGVSVSVLSKIKLDKSPGVTRENVAKIVEAVKVLRHGDRTWSVYENEGSPRLATSEEQSLPQGFTRWRHAGGKTK